MLLQSTLRQEPISKTRPTPKAEKEAAPQGRTAGEWADLVKQRSTLTGLVEPLGVTVGYLSQATENLSVLADGGSALLSGDFDGVGESLSTLVDKGYNPEGLGGAIYNSALALKTVSGALVGGLEIYAGVKSQDKYLTMMGGADLVGAMGHGARLIDLDGTALGLSIASTAAKTALVLTKPEKYSRTQKVKTILDAGGSVASSMLKSGFLVVPALGVSAVAGVGQIAYMNHDGFRGRVDGLIDRVFGPEKSTSAKEFHFS